MCASVGDSGPVPNSSRRNGRRAAAWRVTLSDWARSQGLRTSAVPAACPAPAGGWVAGGGGALRSGVSTIMAASSARSRTAGGAEAVRRAARRDRGGRGLGARRPRTDHRGHRTGGAVELAVERLRAPVGLDALLRAAEHL